VIRPSILAAVAALMLGACGAAQAFDTYSCGDANGEVSVVFDHDAALAEPFTRVEMQITDDYGLSTVPGAEDHSGEFVSAHYAGEDFIGADIMWRDETGKVNGLTVMSLRIVTVYEKPNELITGGVAIGGGGVWTLVCTRS
jgi:hypothetical protein